MVDAGVIFSTLERVSEICGDPGDAVYARLFALRPDFERMFVMDTNGAVRGNMLKTSIDCMLGVAEGSAETPFLLIEAARMHHDGYGLKDGDLDVMFGAMRDVFRDVLAGEWTGAHEREWDAMLGVLAEVH